MSHNDEKSPERNGSERALQERKTSLSRFGTDAVRMVLLEPVEAESKDTLASDAFGWLRSLKQHPIPPILLGLLAAGIGYLTILQTHLYRARSTLEFQNVSDALLSMKIGDFDPAGDPGGPAEGYLQTQVGILQSRSLRKRVLARFENYVPQPTPNRLREAVATLGISIGTTVQPTAGPPLKSQQIRSIPGTRLIEIASVSEDPVFARDFTNAFAKEYIEHLLDARGSATQRTAVWLQKQLEEQKEKLKVTEQQMQEYGRVSGLVFTDDKQIIDQAKLRELQDALGKAIVERTAKQSASELASKASVDPATIAAENRELDETRTKITELRRELAELTTTYSAAHYRVKRVTAQINELETALATQRQNILSRILNEFTTAQRRESLLTTEIQRQMQVVSDRAQKSVYYNLLKHEVDINREIYDTLLHKLKEAGIASAIRASTVRVLDPAEVPTTPFSPAPLNNALIGLATGLLMGMAIVIFKDHADTSLKGPGDALLHLSVPELGVIPSAALTLRKEQGLLTALRARNGNTVLGLEPPQNPIALMTWSDRSSMLAESFRATLASVLFSNSNGTGYKVLTLTSAVPGEGKTTIVSNLAIALAETSKRVLVIDADMRSPRLHDLFEVSNSWGLSDILNETTPLEGLPIESLVRPSKIPGVFLLPSGPAMASIWQLLHSDRMPALLQRLRTEFGAVLIDTPPMLHCPDARVIARHSDAVILVVRARSTSREVVQACCQRFAEDGTEVLGAILNDWQPVNKRDHYYESYYHAYHHETTRT